jgi:hypothetical protein
MDMWVRVLFYPKASRFFCLRGGLAARYGRWTDALRLSGDRWLARTLHIAALLEKRLELALEAL